ncbi:hypothetical protein CMI42_04090 [Candidatus Pacearchaeota archaeon]|nr:hypothetical protein [Candidatus Pacearchaeota archaeon]
MVNRYWNRKAAVSYLEIFLLITSMFAFSYLFYEITDNLYGVSDGVELVSASSSVCCEETLSGQSCQTASSEACNPLFKISPTTCESTDYCEIGCCISENTGLCNLASSRRDCELSGGEFKQGAECNVQECKQGCCILGSEAKWTTEANCAFESNSENKDIFTEWRFDEDSDTELECLFNVEKDKEGACVFEDGGKNKCVYATLEECVSRTGSESNFDHEGRFCSDPELDTICEAKDHKGCLDDNEEVYWFDSCDNREDIAEDCDLFTGSYCGEENGEFICRDVDCGDIGRKNGESWCSYDGKIGDGKDPPGSRHVKHICYFGTERIIPCSDFRNEICVQEDSITEEGDFSQAACRVNLWRECLDHNKNKDKVKDKCGENPDCRFKHIDMGGSFSFDVCLPNYPPGFELSFDQNFFSEDEVSEDYYRASSGDGICSAATQKCTSTWKCSIFGCSCIDNCGCHGGGFANEMNDFCTSLGDCGGYINYVGDYTGGGYSVKGAPGVSADYKQYANKDDSQKADPGDVDFFQTIDPGLLPEIEKDDRNLSAFELELMGASGSYGSPLLLKILTSKNDSSVWGDLGNLAAGSIGLSTFTGAISSVSGAIAAQIDREDPGQPPDFSMIIAMVVATIAYVITQSIVASMIGALLGFLFGISWIITKNVYFSCLPWEPPDGGERCNECNSLDIPCSEYRCESLGSLCKLQNKGTGNEICLAREVNTTLPVITPFETALSEGYEYKDISKDGFEIVNASTNRCIEAYTSVDFGIKVDPFARCRISNNSRDDYGDMSDMFGPKGNHILPAHMTKMFFPNPEAFRNSYNLTDEEIVELGKWNFYVKCKSSSGKVNPRPYQIKTCINPGPDLTSPRITFTSPLQNTYLGFGEEEKDVLFYVNEPSECRWSNEDVDYSEMTNNFECETRASVFTQFGWKCEDTLDVKNNTKFFIKCQDTSENNNVMTESFVYELKHSNSELVIDDVLPKKDERIISGVSPTSVKLRLGTSGGAVNGESVCRWEGNGFGDSFRYEKSNGSSVHDYQVNLIQGKYAIDFFCEDIAGNVANDSTNFVVKIDKFGPRITRIYNDAGLKIVTAENAECRYDFKRNFVYENASKMIGVEKEHHTAWLLKTYYVQCMDEFGNKGGRIKVKPSG